MRVSLLCRDYIELSYYTSENVTRANRLECCYATTSHLASRAGILMAWLDLVNNNYTNISFSCITCAASILFPHFLNILLSFFLYEISFYFFLTKYELKNKTFRWPGQDITLLASHGNLGVYIYIYIYIYI